MLHDGHRIQAIKVRGVTDHRPLPLYPPIWRSADSMQHPKLKKREHRLFRRVARAPPISPPIAKPPTDQHRHRSSAETLATEAAREARTCEDESSPSSARQIIQFRLEVACVIPDRARYRRSPADRMVQSLPPAGGIVGYQHRGEGKGRCAAGQSGKLHPWADGFKH